MAKYDSALLAQFYGDSGNVADDAIQEILGSTYEHRNEMHVLHCPGDLRSLTVMLFPVEYKYRQGIPRRDCAVNQVTYPLSSILFQRRALRFPDRPKFGATVLQTSFDSTSQSGYLVRMGRW